MPEMIQCKVAELTVLERQRARLQWQQQQQQMSFNYNTSSNAVNTDSNGFQDSLGEFSSAINGVVGWPDLSIAGYPVHNFGALSSVRDPPLPAASIAGAVPSPKQSNSSSSGGSMKRKPMNNTTTSQSMAEDSSSEKMIKADTAAVQTKINTEQQQSNKKKFATIDAAKEAALPKQDYIHVRARRGQATDSHSLAERVRRERISERMRYLQELVPGCDKITGKAGMLDEIINYVQSLQRQVEFLSMKLVAVNPSIVFNMDNIFGEEMNPSCSSSISTVGLSPDHMDLCSYLQFNSLQQAAASCSGIDTRMSPLRAPINVADQFLHPCFNVQGAISAWETEMQGLYSVEFQQGRGPVFPPLQSYEGHVVSNNLKMEM